MMVFRTLGLSLMPRLPAVNAIRSPLLTFFWNLELIEKLVDALLNIFEPGSVYLLPDLEDLWVDFP